MDALSSAVIDVVLATEPLPLTLNFVHPHRAAWRDVLHAVNAATGAQLPFVPYKEWLALLEEVAAQENSQENLEKTVSTAFRHAYFRHAIFVHHSFPPLRRRKNTHRSCTPFRPYSLRSSFWTSSADSISSADALPPFPPSRLKQAVWRPTAPPSLRSSVHPCATSRPSTRCTPRSGWRTGGRLAS